MSQQSETSLSTWSAPESPVSIEYPAALLHQIHAYVLQGFRRLSHGGMEVGGVLFGTRDAGRITLQAWRPISCEYSLGPGFALSGADKSDLKGLLAACARDPELRGLEPLGWFASHTRSGLVLLDADRELYEEYFPEPWQVILLLYPQQNAPTQAGFFVREPDGTVPNAARSEFTIEEQQDLEPARHSRERRAPTAVAEAPLESQIPKENTRNRRFLWIGLIVVLSAVAAAFMIGAFRNEAPPPVPEPFSFDAVDNEGQLRIHWDKSAPAVRQAVRGVLEIKDGAKTAKFDLDAEHVRNGSITYSRQGEDVEMRLTVYEPSGTSVKQISQFLGPPPPANNEIESLRQERDRLSAQIAVLQNQLRAERDKSSRLERENKLRDRLLQLDGVIGRHRAPATK